MIVMYTFEIGCALYISPYINVKCLNMLLIQSFMSQYTSTDRQLFNVHLFDQCIVLPSHFLLSFIRPFTVVQSIDRSIARSFEASYQMEFVQRFEEVSLFNRARTLGTTLCLFEWNFYGIDLKGCAPRPFRPLKFSSLISERFVDKKYLFTFSAKEKEHLNGKNFLRYSVRAVDSHRD